MPKTKKLSYTSQSRHSRAARRAGSPSINLDKSLKTAKPPAEGQDYRPAILAIHHGAGVTKKTKRNGPLSTKKRKRLERGAERAESVMDKLEIKLGKSVGKGKTVKGRKAAWDELNARLTADRKVEDAHNQLRGRVQPQHEDGHVSTENQEVVGNATDHIDERSKPPGALALVLPEDDVNEGIQ